MGSGLGGLVCGYILSKNGFDVTVLEKNQQIGGCLQTFCRNDTPFATGMHYIGGMDEGQVLYKFFKYLHLLEDVKLSRLDHSGYEVLSIAGDRYKFASGYESFAEELGSRFPDDMNNIMKYVETIRNNAASSPMYNLQKNISHLFVDESYNKMGFYDLISSITPNKRLQDVLSGNLLMYGGVKDKTPVYIPAVINSINIQSAFRIINGSDSIAQSLAKSIRFFGGKTMTNAEVVKINCDSEKVTSVTLSNGDTIEAHYVISNVHPEATLNKIDSHLIRKAYRHRIGELENSISNFTVYIKFRKNVIPYLNFNYYFHAHEGVWGYLSYDPEKWPETFLFMHQCEQDKQVFAESAKLIGVMRFDEVKKWENTTVERRGSEYLEFKEEKAYKLLQKLEESFPGINAAIEGYYTSTPLTYRDYTATKEGSMFGIVSDKNHLYETMVSVRTKIPNLFLTGQNINIHGILGVMISAVFTCAEFLGIDHLSKQIEQLNSEHG